MSRNHPPDSGRRAKPASTPKIDVPVMVVSALTAFFAVLFVTLLLLRPESSDPTAVMATGARSPQIAPRATAPPVSAPPVKKQPVGARPVTAPPVSAPPPEPILNAEPKPETPDNPTLQTELEQLGVKCAEGADCYPK